jgi:type I restriction enzyme S subunit
MSTNWPKVRLGEVVNDLTDQRIFAVAPDQEILDPTITSATHQIAVAARNTGASVRVIKRVRILPGDLVFSRLHTQNGAFAFADKEFQATGTFIPCSIVEERVDKRFLFWALHVHVPLLSASDTVGRETYKTQDILALEIPLPPLSEQRRIVKIIDSIAKKIQTAKKLRKETTQETEFLLKNFSDRILSRNEYEHIPLPDATFRITKGESPAWQGFSYQESGPVFIRSENVLWGKIDITSCAHIPLEFHAKLARSQLKPNDVLINLVGASIGRACVVPGDMGPANINQAVAVITPDPDKLESNYLLDLLLSQTTQTTLHGGKVETARPNISLDNIKELRLPIPPIHKQRRIVAYLDDLQAKINKLKELQHQTAAELDALLPSILDKAFKAQL